MGLGRNLVLYVAYQLLTLEGVCEGLYVVWLSQHKGLAPASIAVLLAVGDVVLATVEVPTGVLADRLGRKPSLLLGSALQLAGLLTMWLGQGAAAIGLAVVAIALGDAFRDGADVALLHDTCREHGRGDLFGRIVLYQHAACELAVVALMLIGGLLAQGVSFDAAWAVEAALAAAGLAVAFGLREARTASPEEPADPVAPRRMGLLPSGWALVLPATLVVAIAGAAGFQLKSRWHGSLALLTAAVATAHLAEAAGSLLAARTRSYPLKNARIGLTMAALAALAAAGVWWRLAWPVALVAAFTAFLRGWAQPAREIAIQEQAPPAWRATAASAAWIADLAASSMLTPLVAWFAGP